MRGKICGWLSPLLLASATAVYAQTDALVVAPSGNVGIVTLSPEELLEVTASLKAPFLKVPRRCRRTFPAKVVISDAESGEILIEKRAVLSGESRIFTVELLPTFDGVVTRVQIGVVTTARLSQCITADVSAISGTGIRRITPDRITDTDADLDEVIAVRRLGP